MWPLALTSPHAHGQFVKDAQYLLKHNRFKQDFMPDGKADGEFGLATKRAVKRAKYWLGYPQRSITGAYGEHLYKRLLGPKKGGERLTPLMLLRRGRRLKAAKRPGSFGSKGLAEAARHIGVKESPFGSNRNPFGAWYGMNGVPWCAEFVSYCLHKAGSSFRYSYVPNVVYDARHGRNGLQVVRDPKPGDLVCFDWTHDGTADHIGFVLRTTAGSAFETIEGNTGVWGNDSNGGEVMRRTRDRHQVQAFVRVGR